MRFVIAILLAATFAGCTEEPAPEPDVVVEDTPDAIRSEVVFVNATGQTTGLHVEPAPAIVGGTQVHAFEVAPGTGRIDANLAWGSPVFALDMTLVRASGAGVQSTSLAESNRLRITVTDPVPGSYEARISTSAGAAVDYDLSIRMAPVDDASAFLAADVVIPPGQFFEINLQNDMGTVLHWDWTATTASAFNVHTHFDGEVDYVVELTDTEHAGRHEVNRTGGHSLMWENPGNAPQTVSYRAWGDFEVDSYFPPR